MELCMHGLVALSPAVVPQQHGIGRFLDGEVMGQRIDCSRLRRTAKPLGRRRRPPARMSLTTADLLADLKLRDLELQRTNPRTVVAVILGGGAGTRLYPLTKQRAKPAFPQVGYQIGSVQLVGCIETGKTGRLAIVLTQWPTLLPHCRGPCGLGERIEHDLRERGQEAMAVSEFIFGMVVDEEVPIGGAYRLIDVPMSNCINSGINKVYILTQFNSTSLNRHLSRAYNFSNGLSFGDGFVEVLAATQTPGEAGKRWFQGTADAVRQFHWLFEDAKGKEIEDVLILSGDHLYRMDYMDFVQNHRCSGADITISCMPIDDSRASDYGLMKIDNKGRVISFSEKPKGEDLKAMEVDTSVLGLSREQAKKKPYLASMGVYIFKKDILLNLLRWRFPTANDFGSEIIPASAKELFVKAYLFNDYWEDIGTIKSFFEANLALTAHIIDSIVSHGSFLSNCVIEHSVVGIRSRINSNAHLKDAVMLGADYYETNAEVASLLAEGRVPLGIGENTKIQLSI
ncbi:Glucose-1-phosphate adenylyltransferase large subunit 1, chloroplastic [Apostasia shenzhenica]|uniref:glucose-1-phosphate adenylyltransferase n=1 Tax=Apostasia shenzhenica TaxID=1088818 RepID=A0A2I0ARV0_9ASPA|nr:Glucose-1-phosphate adenylyltransferase large subunit 1, chloroplastic [Apostasia shenzhenica]